MNLKEFPESKLTLIAAKPAGELRSFLFSIPESARMKVLRSIPVPGFRESGAAANHQRVVTFVSELHATGSTRDKALALYPNLWHAWVHSQGQLDSLLNEFDNSDDFVDGSQSNPPNSDLDRSCFE